MPSNKAQGARSRYFGDPAYRNTSADHEPPKSYRPKANPSGMLGSEFVSRLADLHMSINEFCRVAGISGGTGTNYSKADKPGVIPAWVDAVLLYAKLDPFYGRRFKSDGPGYVRLRGSDRDMWAAMMVEIENLCGALVSEDFDEAIRSSMSISTRGWVFSRHLVRAKEKALGIGEEGEIDAPES